MTGVSLWLSHNFGLVGPSLNRGFVDTLICVTVMYPLSVLKGADIWQVAERFYFHMIAAMYVK